MSVPTAPRLYVIAGVNGAGKSSIAGATFRALGSDYFNPDEAARRLMAVNPGLGQRDANSAAWRQGVRLLKRALEERLDFAFETTLGGHTITQLLGQAATQGIEIHLWYVGLSSPELHLKRVRERVLRGGHDIPEKDIRRRYEHSRLNLIALLPHLTALRVHDNSQEADLAAGEPPVPQLILQMERAKIVGPPDLSHTPDWAKPIAAAALKLRWS